MRIKTYRVFQFVLMFYMVSAFTWWTILLSQKNKETFELKQEIVKMNNPDYLGELEKEYRKSQWMILGEGLVFALSILVSLLFINRAFWAEIKSNKKLNNFLLSITHELKTPIASLKLINRTLTKKNLPDSHRSNLLDTAFEETNRLESLVNNILTVTQMDNDYNYNFEKIELSEILEQRVNRFKKIYSEFKLHLNSSQKDVTINADYESIIKLIDNLIDNAIKYSGDSRSITIELNQNHEYTTLQVKDNGIGIEDNEKKRILDKFYRIGDEETRSSKGTGLGLFIVKEICKAHKAAIQILDNKPSGTIFKIQFDNRI